MRFFFLDGSAQRFELQTNVFSPCASVMGSGASAEKDIKEADASDLEIKEADLTEAEKARVEEAVKQATAETLQELANERKWRKLAEELKPKLNARFFNAEKPEKAVLFISDGILSWPVAANAVKEDTWQKKVVYRKLHN